MSRIRIVAQDRWDALALLRTLSPAGVFLVKLNSHFEVCFPAPAELDALPTELVEGVESWLVERSLPCATVRLADGSVRELRRPPDWADGGMQ